MLRSRRGGEGERRINDMGAGLTSFAMLSEMILSRDWVGYMGTP